jgi:hypothetical protein
MIEFRHRPGMGSIVLTLFGFLPCAFGQQPVSLEQQVLKRLREIKPNNSKQYIYSIVAPPKPLRLPTSLRLDLVYKIGHYRWSLVAFRFERKEGEPFVNVSQVFFQSALPFWKEHVTVTDSHGEARQTKRSGIRRPAISRLRLI